MARNAKNTRMCAGCRKKCDKSQLVRIYKHNNEFSVAGTNSHTEGRGVYICSSLQCLSVAIKRKSFSRSFKCEIPSDLYDKIEIFVKSINQE